MSTLIITLLVAFVATVSAITLLAIGWLISGRSRVVRGGCGMDPKKLRDGQCGDSHNCALCDREPMKQEPTNAPHSTSKNSH